MVRYFTYLKEGDVVLFNKHKSQLKCTYQYGIVKKIELGKDGLIRRAIVQYRNSNENVDRETYRAARKLIVIHPVDELSLFEELSFNELS